MQDPSGVPAANQANQEVCSGCDDVAGGRLDLSFDVRVLGLKRCQRFIGGRCDFLANLFALLYRNSAATDQGGRGKHSQRADRQPIS
jgi:hypothetical protein